MVTAIISHEVKDYSVWRKGFDSDAENRSKHGFKTVGVFQCHDNPNKVTAIFDVPSAEIAKGFMENPNLKTIMEEAGVISTPDVKILNKIS